MSLFTFILTVAALFMIRSLGRRLDEVTERLSASERLLASLRTEIDHGRRPGEALTTEDQPTPTDAPVIPPVVEPTPPTSDIPQIPPSPTAVSPSSGWRTVPPIGSSPSPDPQAASVSVASLEERIGTRWAVWAGGLTLALGGLLLVRYSIEAGFFGPGMRVFLGALLAAALLAAGEFLRRGEITIDVEALPAAHIPSILTAAGTAIAFGTVYAAHALYGFIGPAAAFVLLGIVGVATLLASLLHGPALAGLGLVGAYVAPLLVDSGAPEAWPVVIYLAVVSATAMGLSRYRRWLWLAVTAIAGACVWGLLLTVSQRTYHYDWALALYAHTLIQLALGAWFIALEPHLETKDPLATFDPIASGALAALTVLASFVIASVPASSGFAMAFIAAVAAILMLTAARCGPAVAAAPLAAIAVLVHMLAWPELRGAQYATFLHAGIADYLRLPEIVSTFLTYATFLTLAVAGAAAWRLHEGRFLRLELSALVALAATALPLLALTIAYLRVTQFDRSIPFALAGVGLAFLFALAADHFQRREEANLPGTRLATGAFAAAAIAGISFALVVSLDRGYLTVALALAALGTAYVSTLRDIPLLRHVVTVLAVVVLGRIAWDPYIMGSGVGETRIFNWLLLGYGVPALAFWAAARAMETRRTDVSVNVADAAAVLFTGLLFTFEIRHALNNGNVLAPTSGHLEQGLLTLVSLGLSYAMLKLDLGRHNIIFRYASLIFGVLSVLQAFFGLGIRFNPLFADDTVIGPILVNSLALAYLVPGFAALFLARAARDIRPRWFVSGILILGVALTFLYVTLAVRHLFHGAHLDIFRHTGSVEFWSYSAAWLALGLALLAYGIWRDRIEPRLASAGLVLLSVAKVFLLDLNGLTGLWRALSFILLGAVLIVIGLVYQKLVFAHPRPPAGTPSST